MHVIVSHALRGAALPVVFYLGPAAAALLTGSVVMETIFGLPAMGRYFVEGALNRDYTLVMGTVMVIAGSCSCSTCGRSRLCDDRSADSLD